LFLGKVEDEAWRAEMDTSNLCWDKGLSDVEAQDPLTRSFGSGDQAMTRSAPRPPPESSAWRSEPPTVRVVVPQRGENADHSLGKILHGLSPFRCEAEIEQLSHHYCSNEFLYLVYDNIDFHL